MLTIADAVRRFKEVYSVKMADYYFQSDTHIAEFLLDNCDHDADGVGWNCYVEISAYDNNTGAPCLIEWFDSNYAHNSKGEA